MRSKGLLFFLICLVGTTVVFLAFNYQRPSIRTFVTETHKQLKSFQKNLKDVEEKRFVTDSKYLASLGLDHQTIADTAIQNSKNVTVITLLRPGKEINIYGFIKNVSHFLPANNVVIYGISLDDDTLQNIRQICNSSKCNVVPFDINLFPSYAEDERLHVYKPLVIQSALHTLGNILYMDSNIRLNNTNISKFLLPESGILTWPTKHATSSLTHPKMYEYFHVSAESFFFLPLVKTSHIIIRNTKEIRDNIMLPWVQCALTRDCICPIGAQSAGCRFNKKPQYRYSGCHSYDTSALNILLGLYFNYEDSRYIDREHKSSFITIQTDKINEEYLSITRQNNASEANIKN